MIYEFQIQFQNPSASLLRLLHLKTTIFIEYNSQVG